MVMRSEEMNKKKLALIIVLAFFAGYCLAAAIYFTAPDVVESQMQIPTIVEVQQMLVDKGYEIEVDGIIGKETLTAWDRAICNEEASKHDYMYEVNE